MELDVGCGYARWGREGYPFSPAVRGPSAIYLDVRPPELPIANFVVADAHHLPFADQALGSVHMRHVLEHLEEPAMAVREARRVLKPGGRLFLEVPGPFSRVQELDPGHRWRFTPWSLKRLLEGFSEVAIRGEGISGRLVPFWPLRLLLGRLLPRVPWFLAEYLVAECAK